MTTLKPRLYRCPKCQSDNLDVEITTWARMEQYVEDGEPTFSTLEGEAQNGSDHEWGEGNAMICRDCGESGAVRDFDTHWDDEDDAVPDGGPPYDAATTTGMYDRGDC